jgi:polysaccharide export outer membrane protein
MLLVTATGPALAQQAKATEAPRQGAGPREYRIGPEDTLEIVVWNNAPLSRIVPVRPDGRITLPLLNDLEAGGRTTTELRNILMQKLKEHMPAPEVSVIVADVRSLKVSVIGEIVRPGRYELKSWGTVLDVLALAGGLNQFASRSRISVLRRDGDNVKSIPFNYNRAISGEGTNENILVQPGDIVLVP